MRSITRFKEAVSFEEAFTQGGLDWKVTSEEVKTSSGLIVPSTFAIIKENGSREVIGTVGGRYEIFQNKEQFDFLKELTEAKDLQIVETMVGGRIPGARVSIITKLPENVLIGGIPEEEHEVRLILSSSHDGSSPLSIQAAVLRLVCTNGLTLTVRQGGQFRIRHTKNGLSKVAQAREALKLTWNYVQNDFQELAKDLMGKSFTSEEMENLSLKLLGYNPAGQEEASTRILNQAKKIVDTFNTAEDLGHVRNTKWAGLQAITHYLDHERSVKGPQEEREAKRIESSIFGQGNNIREEALALLTK